MPPGLQDFSRQRRLKFALGALALAACATAPLIGPTTISLRQVFDPDLPFVHNVDAQIFFIARLPRAVAGALVGGALAAAGVATGVDAVFLEIHEEPARAKSDGQNALRLDRLQPLLERLLRIATAVKP